MASKVIPDFTNEPPNSMEKDLAKNVKKSKEFFKREAFWGILLWGSLCLLTSLVGPVNGSESAYSTSIVSLEKLANSDLRIVRNLLKGREKLPGNSSLHKIYERFTNKPDVSNRTVYKTGSRVYLDGIGLQHNIISIG